MDMYTATQIFVKLCEGVKSTENYTIEYVKDGTGIRFFDNGYYVTITYKNKSYLFAYDLFTIFDAIDVTNNKNWWSDAKDIIIDYADYVSDEIENYNENVDCSEEELKEIEEIVRDCFKYITQQIESAASHEDIDLNTLFYDPDED